MTGNNPVQLSALEQEIIDKYRQLDEDAKARIRAIMDREDYEAKKAAFDYDAWFRDMEAFHEQIKANHGGVFPKIDAIGMLREIRDDEDDE